MTCMQIYVYTYECVCVPQLSLNCWQCVVDCTKLQWILLLAYLASIHLLPPSFPEHPTNFVAVYTISLCES